MFSTARSPLIPIGRDTIGHSDAEGFKHLPSAVGIPAGSTYSLFHDGNGAAYWGASVGGGTVTSVGLAMPGSVFTVSSSPITGAGTLSVAFASQSANTVFAAPNGSAGAPSFRALDMADIGTGTLSVARGGTGISAPGATAGNLRWNGTAFVIDTATYLTGNQTITLSGDVTGSGATSISTTVGKINGISLAGLATGILKNTTTTGVPSIAVAGTDYVSPSGLITALGLYVLKTGDAMSGGLSIGIAGTTPYPLGPYVPLSVSGNDYSSIVVKSTSAARTAAIAFNTASTSGTSWAIGKRDDGNNGTPTGSLAIWDDILARFWMTPSLASFRVNLETTGELRYNGGVFRDLAPSSAYTAFYPSLVTPSSVLYNYSLALKKDGVESWLSGTTSSHLAVNGVYVVRALAAGAQVAGTLSSTGHLTAPSATIGSSTAMLKRVAGALTDAVAGTDYLPPPAVGGNASLFLRGDGVWSNTLAGSGASLTIHAASISSDHTNNWVTHNVAIDAWGHSFQGNGTSLLTLMPGSVKLPGCTFRNDVFDPLVYAIYGSAVATPSNTNGSVYIGKDGGITSINGSSLSALLVGGSIRVAANSAGAQVTGTLSATGGFSAPSATISGLSAGGMLKAQATTGAVQIATENVDYIKDAIRGPLKYRSTAQWGYEIYPATIEKVEGAGFNTFVLSASGPGSSVRFLCSNDGGSTMTTAGTFGAEPGGLGYLDTPILKASSAHIQNLNISGVMELQQIEVTTSTYTLPPVAPKQTIQIVFNVGACDVSTGAQTVSLRRDDGSLGNEAAGTVIGASFGRTGSRMRSILLVGLTSTIASIVG